MNAAQQLVDLSHRIGWPPIAAVITVGYFTFLAAVLRKANHRHARFIVLPHPHHRGGRHSSREQHREKATKRHERKHAADSDSTPALTVRTAA